MIQNPVCICSGRLASSVGSNPDFPFSADTTHIFPLDYGNLMLLALLPFPALKPL